MPLNQKQTDLINEMKRSPLKAITFGYDNNPKAFINRLSAMGFSDMFDGSKDDRAKAIRLVFSWVRESQFGKIKELFNALNYLDASPDSAVYTRGFRDYFVNNTPQSLVNSTNISQGTNTAQRFSFDGLLAALGTGLTTYTAISGQEGTGGGIIKTPAQIAAEKEAQAKKTRQNWTIGLSVLGLGVIVGLVIYFTKK